MLSSYSYSPSLSPVHEEPAATASCMFRAGAASAAPCLMAAYLALAVSSHAREEHSRHSVLPVPVGDSRMPLTPW